MFIFYAQVKPNAFSPFSTPLARLGPPLLARICPYPPRQPLAEREGACLQELLRGGVGEGLSVFFLMLMQQLLLQEGGAGKQEPPSWLQLERSL